MTFWKCCPVTAAFALAGCSQLTSSLNQPISSDYSPLDGPSVNYEKRQQLQQTGPSYQPGQWVETVMPNGTFFSRIPKGSASADQVLARGTPMKVIATKDSYVKVELENGSVGFVPAIMVAEPSNEGDSSPLLPPPPSAPLERSSPTLSDDAPAASPNAPSAPGGSAIPAPSNFNEDSAPSPAPQSQPQRNASEVLIPTSAGPSPSFTEPELEEDMGPGAIPPPSN
jgi:hypothetical protein